jgi:hypothetical protein
MYSQHEAQSPRILTPFISIRGAQNNHCGMPRVLDNVYRQLRPIESVSEALLMSGALLMLHLTAHLHAPQSLIMVANPRMVRSFNSVVIYIRCYVVPSSTCCSTIPRPRT